MFYDRLMSDMTPPPPPPSNASQPGQSAPGGTDVWGDDTTGRVGFGNRLGGYLLDVVLYGIVAFVPFYFGTWMSAAALFGCDLTVTECFTGFSAWRYVGGIAISFGGLLLVLVVYFRALGRTGQTWGRRIVGNKLIRVDTGDVPGIGRAIGRELFGWIVSASIMYLGYLWMIWDKDRQTWHDKVAGTVVVRSR